MSLHPVTSILPDEKIKKAPSFDVKRTLTALCSLGSYLTFLPILDNLSDNCSRSISVGCLYSACNIAIRLLWIP